MHCETNVWSTHILVALRRGWEKDRRCYVHLALLPTDWNKSAAKCTCDDQKRHDHVTQTTMHSNSPCQKPLTNPESQSTLEFPCPKPCPKITLHSASVHPSADVLGNRVVFMADVLPAVLLHQVHRKFIREYWARRMYHIHRDTKNIIFMMLSTEMCLQYSSLVLPPNSGQNQVKRVCSIFIVVGEC